MQELQNFGGNSFAGGPEIVTEIGVQVLDDFC